VNVQLRLVLPVRVLEERRDGEVVRVDVPAAGGGSATQAELSGVRPATTVRAVAGSRGSRLVRNQSSSGANRSYVSSSSTSRPVSGGPTMARSPSGTSS